MASSKIFQEKQLSANNQNSDKMMLPESLKSEIDHWIAKYPNDQKQSALIPALLMAQKHHQGWLSPTLIQAVADYLQVPHIQAYEVATFYSMLELKPIGRNLICICTNVSCMLNGSDTISSYFEKRLSLHFGETSEDQRFTLKEVECLGACTNAPVMTINGTYYENITVEKLDEILQETAE